MSRSLAPFWRSVSISLAKRRGLPFDNLGRLSEWLSDALARIATGIAFAKRKLFTDMDETLLTAEKPIAINSIIDIVGAADLGERSIFITPPAIGKGKRKDKKE